MRARLIFGLCVILSAAVLHAQTISTSQIRGTVQDPSGAAVAGAQVKLTQVATGAVRTATTGSDGSYTLPDLSVGAYQLEVTKEGFSKYVQTGIVLQVGVNPTIDVALKVGAVTQEVTVAAQGVTVETQSTGVGEVVVPQQVQDLPLNGRQLTDLLTLSGAVGQGRAFRASYPSSAVISIAGGAQGSVAYWLDGGTHNDPLSNQNLPLPFPDTVEEFKVETSSLPAQYGTHPSGAVNVVTKSGTNSFHGDVFEYVRNFMFDSRNTAFAGGQSPFVKRDDLKRNQFGGTIGGPIMKDKLFFFLGWQDTIQRSTNPAQTTLPTDAMLAGDFTAFAAANCSGPGLVLGPPFAGNMTSPSNYSPVTLALESHLPVPQSATSPCGTFNYQSPLNFTENQGLGRIDYQASNRNTLFARYFITNWNQPPGNPSLPASQGGLLIAAIDGAFNRVQNLTIGDTYLIGTNTVNSIRVTGNRSRNLTVQNSTIDLADLGVPVGNVFQLGPPKFPKYMAGFNVAGGFFGLFNSTPSLQPYDTLEFSDGFSQTRGAHQLLFGVDVINLRAFATNYLFNQGNFTFDGSRTGTRVGLADFLLGETSATNGFSQDAPIPSLQHQNIFSLYAQDAWKITRRVTITAGLRWDPFFGHTDPKGHVVNIDIPDLINNVHSKLFPTAPAGYLFNGDPGGPSNNKLTKNSLNKWSPRLGVAWDPRGDGRMSVRAGFGIFYDFPNFSYDQFGFEEPYGGAVSVPGAPCPSFPCSIDITNPWSNFTFKDQAGTLHNGNPFPQFVGTGPQNAAYLPGALVFSYPQNIKPTYVMQYNLSVQKQLGTNWLVSVNYLGSQQRHLWGNNEANPGMQGACPVAYPLPPGVTCHTPPFPCPTPPFLCGSIFGPAFSLANNRMFAEFNAPAGGGVGPQGGPLYGETLLLEEQGTGNYNGLVLSAQHNFANHFTSTTNFTWSHCISDNYTTTLGFFLAAEAMPYNRRYDRGNCPNADTHNIFNQSLVAETPKFSNHLTDILVGHWRLSLSGIFQSGTDVSPILILDFSGSGNGLTQRPNLIGNPNAGGPVAANPKCNAPATVHNRNNWFNPCAFAFPAPYTFGNLKNNSLFGPGSIIVNTALERLFQIREGKQVSFRWEVFNLPNHANLFPPQGAFVLSTFGEPTPSSTAGLGALNQTTNDPRVMQFALKYMF
ncbi:MAG TPA: TonB-dependent receptor [Candidatus Acidoferrales bacterium]|nr:TonB-dependent receptor [Candidatus Acidoferrales bacterium]